VYREDVEARVGPGDEVGDEAHFDGEASGEALEVEVVTHLEEVDDDVGRVVQEHDHHSLVGIAVVS